MSPPVTTFPAHRLGYHVRYNSAGKLRKPAITGGSGGSGNDNGSAGDTSASTNSNANANANATATPFSNDAHLGPYADRQRPWERCRLMEMTQWSCEPEDRRDGRLVCREVVRMLRRCANGVTIETTALE